MLTNKRLLPPLSFEQKIELSTHIYITKNSIYLSNLPNELFMKDILYQKKFLGQYGHINQIIIDKKNKKENKVIIKFDTVNQAALAILSLHNFKLNNGYQINIMYYLTKYCNYFLNNRECPNQNCLFLHSLSINDYQYYRISNSNKFDSFQFALDLLNIPKQVFEIIKFKLIEENYYEKNKKFPKLTIKKLKNQEFLKKIYPIALQEYKSKEKNNKSDSNENSKLSSEDDSTIDSYKNKNYSFRRRNNSRFNFIKKEKENDKYSIVVPDFVLDFIDKSIFYNLYVNNKKNDNEMYRTNFHDDWKNILFGNN